MFFKLDQVRSGQVGAGRGKARQLEQSIERLSFDRANAPEIPRILSLLLTYLLRYEGAFSTTGEDRNAIVGSTFVPAVFLYDAPSRMHDPTRQAVATDLSCFWPCNGYIHTQTHTYLFYSFSHHTYIHTHIPTEKHAYIRPQTRILTYTH